MSQDEAEDPVDFSKSTTISFLLEGSMDSFQPPTFSKWLARALELKLGQVRYITHSIMYRPESWSSSPRSSIGMSPKSSQEKEPPPIEKFAVTIEMAELTETTSVEVQEFVDGTIGKRTTLGFLVNQAVVH